MTLAHDIDNIKRTADVYIHENVDFTGMLLSEEVLAGITSAGFRIPSPIQLKSVPLGLCGFDLIVEAKSGTGKTVVFSIIALETVLKNPKNTPQVLILTPTREIAVQIQEVLNTIGSKITDFRTEYFIGGIPEAEDIQTLHKNKINIAIGAPGRIKSLIEKGALSTKSMKLLILDEADKLMLDSFKPDIDYINSRLPEAKQIIATSATYSDKTEIENLMQNPTTVTAESDIPTLIGVRQFISIIPTHLNTIRQLKYQTEEFIRIISNVPFKQLIVFTNYQNRAESLSNNLCQLGWPAVFISGSQTQTERLEALAQFRNQKYRILVSTDVTARGIDISDVNFVVNYDVPRESATYLHRIGRAGRYGSQGLCITICPTGDNLNKFKNILSEISTEFALNIFPKGVPTSNIWKDTFEKMVINELGQDEIKSNGHQIESTNGHIEEITEAKVEEIDKIKEDTQSEKVKITEDTHDRNLETVDDIKEEINKPTEEINEDKIFGTIMQPDLTTTPQAIAEKQKQELIFKENMALLNLGKLLTSSKSIEQIKSFQEIQGILASRKKILSFSNLLSAVEEQRVEKPVVIKFSSTSTTQITDETIEAIEYCLQCERDERERIKETKSKNKKNSLKALQTNLQTDSESEVEVIQSRVVLDPSNFKKQKYEVLDKSKIKKRELVKDLDKSLARNLRQSSSSSYSSSSSESSVDEPVGFECKEKRALNRKPISKDLVRNTRNFQNTSLYGGWYSMWREQLNHIQTHVHMSKLY